MHVYISYEKSSLICRRRKNYNEPQNNVLLLNIKIKTTSLKLKIFKFSKYNSQLGMLFMETNIYFNNLVYEAMQFHCL